MIIKLENDPTWTEKDKMGFVLSRNSKNVRALIQLDDTSRTSTPRHKTCPRRWKIHVMTHTGKLRHTLCIATFTRVSENALTTSCPNSRHTLHKQKPLRDGIHPCLSLYLTFTDIREQLGLLFCELEAEKKRSTREYYHDYRSPSDNESFSKPERQTLTNSTTSTLVCLQTEPRRWRHTAKN